MVRLKLLLGLFGEWTVAFVFDTTASNSSTNRGASQTKLTDCPRKIYLVPGMLTRHHV